MISRDTPQHTRHAIAPKLLPSYQSQIESGPEVGEGEPVEKPLDIRGFDWALHIGGEAIIEGAKCSGID